MASTDGLERAWGEGDRIEVGNLDIHAAAYRRGIRTNVMCLL